MPNERLTRRQSELKKELDAIAETIGVDYWNILDREPAFRTSFLAAMKRELIRGEIVSGYTLIDEMLAMKLCQYFFPGQNFMQLWKTKRFQRFNYYILERLYLTNKLAFVKDLYEVPKKIAGIIEEVNALRNAMAHAFFPENLRAFQMKGRPAPRKPIVVRYKGLDVFTHAGIERFVEDCLEAVDYVLRNLKRRKRQTAIRVPLPMEVGESVLG